MNQYGFHAKARAAFIRAREIGGDPGNFYNNMAATYYREKRWDLAEEYLLEAVSIEPNKFSFNKNYAAALSYQGRKAEAIAYMQEYIKRADYEDIARAEEFIGLLKNNP